MPAKAIHVIGGGERDWMLDTQFVRPAGDMGVHERLHHIAIQGIVNAAMDAPLKGQQTTG